MAYASLTADLVRVPRRGERARGAETGRERRALVLTDEGARHPYRSTLPPHLRADLIDIPAERLWDLTRDDVRGFASTYVTVTAAVLAFIL
ncbi:hypothetical protein [Erythrobacter sp.]|uniref:hypothetical protein n=1 Tax=Erythrobacter sp. TaxID=1042 RepID=UPI001425C6B5|nr:hypothetical protein [Erythrobacter sp.]QIQ86495.1 MAG: hypothetical protein G9473_07180 [Erythrobacter sp.]